MERKRIEKFVALLLVGILMPVSLFPFRINADTITTSNINGISITLDEVTYIDTRQFTIDGVLTNVTRNYFNYIAEIQLDKSYLGNFNIVMNYTYQAKNDTGNVTYNSSYGQKVFVNGDKAYMSFGFIANSNTDPLWYNSITYSLSNSDVIEYGLISDIQQIVNILEDNQDIIEDIYTELQKVVSNTSLANDYLETIAQYRQWQFPIESYSFLSYWFSNNRELIDYYLPNNYYKFPRFKMNANQYIIQGFYVPADFNDVYVVLLLQTGSGSSTIQSLRTPAANNFEYTNISYFNDAVYGLSYLRLYHYWNLNVRNFYIQYPNDCYVTPIYIGYNTSYISTDFALQFGLSNRLLDDIRLIANGTNQSSSASGSLDQTTSQFSDDANDLITIEESFNDSMNDSLENVSPVFNMGSSFLTSANWVSQQFNRIVNNTPFASLITFGLTLGLGLLIIGKVRK